VTFKLKPLYLRLDFIISKPKKNPESYFAGFNYKVTVEKIKYSDAERPIKSSILLVQGFKNRWNKNNYSIVGLL